MIHASLLRDWTLPRFIYASLSSWIRDGQREAAHDDLIIVEKIEWLTADCQRLGLFKLHHSESGKVFHTLIFKRPLKCRHFSLTTRLRCTFVELLWDALNLFIEAFAYKRCWTGNYLRLLTVPHYVDDISFTTVGYYLLFTIYVKMSQNQR